MPVIPTAPFQQLPALEGKIVTIPTNLEGNQPLLIF